MAVIEGVSSTLRATPWSVLPCFSTFSKEVVSIWVDGEKDEEESCEDDFGRFH